MATHGCTYPKAKAHFDALWALSYCVESRLPRKTVTVAIPNIREMVDVANSQQEEAFSCTWPSVFTNNEPYPKIC